MRLRPSFVIERGRHRFYPVGLSSLLQRFSAGALALACCKAHVTTNGGRTLGGVGSFLTRPGCALRKCFNCARAQSRDTISPDANGPASPPDSPAVMEWKTGGGSGRGEPERGGDG